MTIQRQQKRARLKKEYPDDRGKMPVRLLFERRGDDFTLSIVVEWSKMDLTQSGKWYFSHLHCIRNFSAPMTRGERCFMNG